MSRASSASERVRTHFRSAATSFDRLYDEEHAVQRLARPGLLRRRDLALRVLQRFQDGSVLDVGCGSGRVAEALLEAGAASYVGVDFSGPMIELARERLARFGQAARLVEGDFLTEELDGPFDVVLALGVFDYLPEPAPFVRRMAELCSGAIVASFPRWTWTRGPIRKVRYEVIADCPIFDYTERELRLMLGAAGFERIEVTRGRSGYLATASAAGS